MSTLAGKVALVTGASRGIGASVARMLAGRGADIAINYHSKASRAEGTAMEVRAGGRRALLVQADMTNAADVHSMMDAVRREYQAGSLPTIDEFARAIVDTASSKELDGSTIFVGSTR
jgi:3-oxoacyl-[acyl-carrier protein] reductase